VKSSRRCGGNSTAAGAYPDPRAYIEAAVAAHMDGREVPLPHEIAAATNGDAAKS
jgi:hypothetical protein